MERRAAVIIAEGTEEIEAITPGDVLARAGVGVTYLGVGTTTPTGSRGLPLRADTLVEMAGDDLFDAVVVPGGTKGAANIAASDFACALISRHAQEEKLIGAICAAPAVVLAPLGLLDGRRATCYPGLEERFGHTTTHGIEDVVEDGNLITSRGAGTAMAFSLVLARRLTDEQTARKVAEGMLVS